MISGTIRDHLSVPLLVSHIDYDGREVCRMNYHVTQ